LYIDEVSIGVNANSILRTGRDEHNVRFPLYFESFGEYKLPIYIYSTSLSTAVFGKTPLAVRLPSVISGTATAAVLILLAALLSKNRKLSLLTGFILAVTPWHIQFSRAGFEANMALLFVSAGVYALVLGFEKNYYLIISLILFLLSFFTYLSARIFLPLFLMIFLVWQRKKAWEITKKKSVFIIIFLILLIPVLFNSLTPQALIRARSVSFIREVKANPDTFFSDKTLLTIEQFFKNYLKNYSLEFLFFIGDGNGRHGTRELGGLFLWQLPFLIIGLSKASKSKLMLFWLLLAPIPAAVSLPNPHALRSLMLVAPLSYFTGAGVQQFFRNQNFKKFRLIVLFELICVYFLFLYLHVYFVHYPKRTDPDWSGGYREAIEYVSSRVNNYDTVFITDKMEKIYLYYYGNPPAGKEAGKITAKYTFVSSPFQERPEGRVLYLSPYWEKWHGKLVSEIKNKGGDLVFNIWEN